MVARGMVCVHIMDAGHQNIGYLCLGEFVVVETGGFVKGGYGNRLVLVDSLNRYVRVESTALARWPNKRF